MDTLMPKDEGIAQVATESDIYNLAKSVATLRQMICFRENTKNTPELETAIEAYLRCLENTMDLIDVSDEDYDINTDTRQFIPKAESLIYRLKRAGVYKVGRRQSRLLPLHVSNKHIKS